MHGRFRCLHEHFRFGAGMILPSFVAASLAWQPIASAVKLRGRTTQRDGRKNAIIPY
jgi:hypothetical protein